MVAEQSITLLRRVVDLHYFFSSSLLSTPAALSWRLAPWLFDLGLRTHLKGVQQCSCD